MPLPDRVVKIAAFIALLVAAGGAAAGERAAPDNHARPQAVQAREAEPRANAAEAAPGDAPAGAEDAPPGAAASPEARPLGGADPPPARRGRPGSGAEPLGGARDGAPPASPDPRRGEIVRVGGALAAVLGLLFLVRALLRRAGGPLAGGGRPSGVVAVLARYPIARGQQLVLLKVGARVVLLHQSRHAVAALSELSEPGEVAELLASIEAGAREGGGGRFQSLMARWAAEPAAPRHGALRRTDLEGNEVIDLTRRGTRGRLGGLVGRRGLP